MVMEYTREKLSKFIWREKEERGDFKVGGGASSKFEIEDADRKRTPLKDLEWYYWNFGPLFRGLNLKAASIWGRGFKIKSDDKEAVELCTNATLEMPGFKQWFITESAHALIYGMGPGEIIWDDVNVLDKDGNIVLDGDGFPKKSEEGKNIIGYTITDAKTLTPAWDAQGYIGHWTQKIFTSTGAQEEMKHKARKICYFKYFSIADNVKGMGLVESNITTINALMTAQKSSRDLLFRHGIPFVHVTKIGAQAKDVPKLSKIGQDFNNKTHLASSEKIKIDLIGIKGKSVDVKPHLDELQDNLAGGLGIPKAILFAAGETVNRATLTELMTMTSAEIKSIYQEVASDIIENQIFVPLLKANDMKYDKPPQVVWEPLDEKRESEILENMKIFTESMAKMVQTGVYSPEEVKEIMNKKFKLGEKE